MRRHRPAAVAASIRRTAPGRMRDARRQPPRSSCSSHIERLKRGIERIHAVTV